ncbi:unnamed protein product [Paramecium pentaurelia]|uniref:Uncharacterized protein n=1 Tax=Paramecium pentaurelia TaxID=43138 RepID=A0A8S1UXB1_9CILI|nr:unnamed protein product [Paramecium pentaurelia]
MNLKFDKSKTLKLIIHKYGIFEQKVVMIEKRQFWYLGVNLRESINQEMALSEKHMES